MKLKLLFTILMMISCSACSPSKETDMDNQHQTAAKPLSADDQYKARLAELKAEQRQREESIRLNKKEHDRVVAAYENSPFIVRNGKIEVLEQHKPLTKFQGYHQFLIEQAYENVKIINIPEGTKAVVSYERSKTIVLFNGRPRSGKKSSGYLTKTYINPDTGEVNSSLMGN